MQQYQNMPFGFPMGPFVTGSPLFPHIPYVDDCDLFISSNITSVGPPGPPGPPGPEGPQGPPGNPGLVPTAIVTTTPFNVTTDMYFIGVNVDAPTDIVLPISPDGTVFIVKDIDGDASINPITITASALIDGSASATINAPYGALQFVFNGTEWNIV